MAREPARVGIPRIVSGFVPRSELQARLDEPARLSVVRGRPGAGKSTLVAGWIRETDPSIDVLWVTRPPRVDARRAYWSIVLDELDRFGVDGVAIPAQVSAIRRTVAAAFVALARPLLLVLDNFGPPGPDWDEIAVDVSAALAAAPGLSVIVIGRAPTLLESPRAGAGVILGDDVLRLAPAEARRIAEAEGLGGLSDAAIDGVLAEADGNAFEFRFAIEAAVHRSIAADAATARELHELGDDLAAIPYALRARDFDLAAHLFVVRFVDFEPGDIGELEAMIAAIEPADLAAQPALALVTALLRAPSGDRERARAIYALALDAARARRQPQLSAAHRFTLAATEAVVLRALGRGAPSVEAARATLAAAREMSRGERAAMSGTLPLLLGHAGLSAFYGLDPALAHACFNAELSASPRETYGRRRNMALSHLAMLAVLGGRMGRAQRLNADIVPDDWHLERPGARASAPSAIAAAYLALNRGDTAAALEVLDELGDDRPPASENWGLTAVARALARAMGGDADLARSELEAEDAARRSPAERLGAVVAGVDTTVELLRLMTSGRVVAPAREGRLDGRAAVMQLIVRALRAALGGRSAAATELLVRATRFGISPLQELCAALVGAIVGRRDGTELRACAERIARVVAEQGLAWPLAILGDAERAALTEALEAQEAIETLRAAFSRIPPSIRLAPEVVELHPRELAVLRDLAETSSRAELAERSVVSVNTIKTQLRSLYRKLGATDRDSALARAAELGLLDESVGS